jgi:hypothetical protein
MVKITYQKMKAVSPNVIIVAGILSGSDIDYLNEMYKSGIKNYYTVLAMHPYTSPYPIGKKMYGGENFYCFKKGVEKVRDYMIKQMDSSKPIWFTEFGFSSFNGWNGAGLQGEANHLERAIDIIRTEWPFVQVACVHETSNFGITLSSMG